MGLETGEAPSAVERPLFATTHWSVVIAASDGESAKAALALEQLCSTYWYPLYFYVRRRGYSAQDAEDLTQEFLACLLQHEYFRFADPTRGRFRTFLLHGLEHFMINQWKRACRLKRGGGATLLSLDTATGERLYAQEPAMSIAPERAYERRWALVLIDRTMNRLRQEYVLAGKDRLFEEMSQFLWGRDGSTAPRTYAAVGEGLGMTEGAVKMAAFRLRDRCRELLRAEVAQTVASPDEVQEELKCLLRAVADRA